MLRFEAVEPDRRARAAQLGLRELRQLEEVRAAPTSQLLGSAGLLESLERELADRLQHPETLLRVADEALFDERLQRVEVGVGHFLSRLERAAAGKDGQVGEKELLILGEQIV